MYCAESAYIISGENSCEKREHPSIHETTTDALHIRRHSVQPMLVYILRSRAGGAAADADEGGVAAPGWRRRDMARSVGHGRARWSYGAARWRHAAGSMWCMALLRAAENLISLYVWYITSVKRKLW